MYDNKLLFNYMFLRSKPKRFLKKSKAMPLAFQASLFSRDTASSLMNATNLFQKEKNIVLRKNAELGKEQIENSLSEVAITGAQIKSISDKRQRLVVLKANKKGLNDFSDIGLTDAEKQKVIDAGGLEKLSYPEIMEKLKF